MLFHVTCELDKLFVAFIQFRVFCLGKWRAIVIVQVCIGSLGYPSRMQHESWLFKSNKMSDCVESLFYHSCI